MAISIAPTAATAAACSSARVRVSPASRPAMYA